MREHDAIREEERDLVCTWCSTAHYQQVSVLRDMDRVRQSSDYRERRISSQLYNWMHSTEKSLNQRGAGGCLNQLPCHQRPGNSGLPALLRTTDFYLVSLGIRSSNLSLTSPMVLPARLLAAPTAIDMCCNAVLCGDLGFRTSPRLTQPELFFQNGFF